MVILYTVFKGKGYNFQQKKNCISFSEKLLVLANSADPDEMLHPSLFAIVSISVFPAHKGLLMKFVH